MTMRLCLMEDEKVLFSLPLAWRSGAEPSFALTGEELDRLSNLYAVGSNRKRLGVMLELVKGRELRFSDVMQLVTNPKLARDSLQPMVEEGLVLHEKGMGYRPSETGLRVLLVLTLGFGKILALIEGEREDRQR